MICENFLLWNVRGLNSRSRRNVVHELVGQERASLISLQETKLDDCDDTMIRELFGLGFEFASLPACHTCGGILLAWKGDVWSVSNISRGEFSLTAKVTLKSSDVSWWLTSVYGPQSDLDKVRFLDELRMIRSSCSDSWMVCGDFNLIYKAEDKNNSNLNRRMMGRFRRFIDDMELQELSLMGRLYS